MSTCPNTQWIEDLILNAQYVRREPSLQKGHKTHHVCYVLLPKMEADGRTNVFIPTCSLSRGGRSGLDLGKSFSCVLKIHFSACVAPIRGGPRGMAHGGNPHMLLGKVTDSLPCDGWIEWVHPHQLCLGQRVLDSSMENVLSFLLLRGYDSVLEQRRESEQITISQWKLLFHSKFLRPKGFLHWRRWWL